ncbi:MAG: hypothetical protein E7004_03645 [Alphaproteobacteria bacterium]|nr:hypothetical protein [Alphaproteobacteria bacterium]
MVKKVVFFILLVLFLINPFVTKAQTGGNVYLDLKEDEVLERGTLDNVPSLIELGKRYIDDVVEYDDILEGDAINKDFSDDFKIKYKNYNKKKNEEWERYVRNGVKTYRWYKDIKSKVINWLMEDETPLIVDDSQYEMGEQEEYIPSDKPVVIKDFKKVVAYSGLKKDVEAAEDKRARDAKQPTPSDVLRKYKKIIMEQKWVEFLKDSWSKIKKDIYNLPDVGVDGKAKKAKSIVLSDSNFANEDGKIRGTIEIELLPQNMLLFNKYKEYDGIKINFDKSENIKNVKFNFMMPQSFELEKIGVVTAYVNDFSIYYEAEVTDRSKPIIIKPTITANVCDKSACDNIVMEPYTKLEPVEKISKTLYSSHITMVAMNVAKETNKDNYEIGDVVFEKKNDGFLGSVRLDIETSNLPNIDAFIVGDEASYFKMPRYSIENDRVVIRFDLDDMSFNPLDKELSFWLSDGNTNNYIHKQKVREMSLFDISSGLMSWGILGFAFLGGILLNLMPCVFPVLSLKLLNYSRFGKLSEIQIRRNFIFNSIGILSSFGVMACILAGLKMFGLAIGWGMQFQSISFLVAVLWVVIFFLAYVMGLIDFTLPDVNKKLDDYSSKSKIFEFLSGVFLVLLSTPCMAPYLGTAFGVALAGDVKSIVATVMVVGLGLSAPYILIAACPKIALYIPKPGKWMLWVNFVMLVLLIVTVVWLLSILAVQSTTAQIWHWILYIAVMLVVLSFWKAVRKEINRQKDENISLRLHKKFTYIFSVVILLIISISFVDVRISANQRKEFINENRTKVLDVAYIGGMVNNGNKILVKVGADWCLTCKFNDVMAFNIENIKDDFVRNNVFVIEVDWTKYQPQVLRFMQKFGRSGLPFYVLFSQRYPKGIVLPEIIDDYDLKRLIEK